MIITKWSPEWLATLTMAQLTVQRDIARAIAIICGVPCNSLARGMRWERRLDAVEKEISRRTQ